ncbi:MAG TPA: DUF2171 domain-containing protein, partial [Allosphingosinicella sp.]
MGNYRSDDRYGGGRDREYDSRMRESGRSGRGEYGRGDYGRGGEDDRGFFDRAGDEVRSWFGDDEAERRREMDRQRWEREQAQGGGYNRDREWDRGGYEGRGWRGERAGSGWGNETSGGMRGNRSSGGGYSSFEEGPGSYGRSYGSSGPQDTWGGSGYGGSEFGGRRFDRVDAGSTGTHGAHPMSAPYGAGGGMYGASAGYRSSARSAAIYGSQGGQGEHHDRHYSEWRNRQISELDRDYDEYRREHQSKFEQEFGSWRSKRQTQRSSLSKVTEHMDVVGSDGEHVGTVDKVRGDRIILTKSDPSAGGHHHSIPCAWIENVEDKVTLNKSAKDAMQAWQD